MFGRVNSPPLLFAQAFEIKDGPRLCRLKSIAQQMDNLLTDRSVLALRPSLELFVESIGKVLDVQDHHMPPMILHYGGTVVLREDDGWRVPRMQGAAGP